MINAKEARKLFKDTWGKKSVKEDEVRAKGLLE